MEDKKIIDLYWHRSEEAIKETDIKYGKYCRSIAANILSNPQDCEECVSDTYLKTWNSIPPQRPTNLQAFLAKITRNLALSRFRHIHAEKRGSGQVALVLDELQKAIPGGQTPDDYLDLKVLEQILNQFVGSLKPEAR